METYPSDEITDYPFGLNSEQSPIKKKKRIRFSDLASEEIKQLFKYSQSPENTNTL